MKTWLIIGAIFVGLNKRRTYGHSENFFIFLIFIHGAWSNASLKFANVSGANISKRVAYSPVWNAAQNA